jgi:hypothetical protein
MIVVHRGASRDAQGTPLKLRRGAIPLNDNLALDGKGYVSLQYCVYYEKSEVYYE